MAVTIKIPKGCTVAGSIIEKIIKTGGLDGVSVQEALGPENGTPAIHIVSKYEDKSEKSIILKTPVRIGEIIDSVRSLVRANDEKSGLFNIANFTFNAAMNEISGNGKTIRLTEKESAILTLLARDPGAIHSREYLLQALWGYAENIETHTLESHIYRIRQKIESDPSNPKIIITAETGYFLSG
jgi:DNA-binding response OmpR family regulator